LGKKVADQVCNSATFFLNLVADEEVARQVAVTEFGINGQKR